MCIAWLCLVVPGHFAGYVLYFRGTSAGRTESGIFHYHLFSFIAISMIGSITFFIRPEDEIAAGAILSICLHAIYSMTFLEFWSLSQGSFSHAILVRLSQWDHTTKGDLIQEFNILGASKKTNRVAVLSRLGLIRRDPTGAWELTMLGNLGASIIAILLWLPATRNRG
jgi:hypothetical protein